jgi:hypothetical protein
VSTTLLTAKVKVDRLHFPPPSLHLPSTFPPTLLVPTSPYLCLANQEPRTTKLELFPCAYDLPRCQPIPPSFVIPLPQNLSFYIYSTLVCLPPGWEAQPLCFVSVCELCDFVSPKGFNSITCTLN